MGCPHLMQEHADFCLKHGTNCVVNRPRTDLNLCNRPQGIFSGSLIVGNAGNCCQGWSSEGKRARKAHSSQHAWNSWLAQRRELALRSEEDMFFQECTEVWDVEGCLVKPLEDSFIQPLGLPPWDGQLLVTVSCQLAYLPTVLYGLGPQGPML